MAREFETEMWKRSAFIFPVIVSLLIVVSSNYADAKSVVKYNSQNQPCICVWLSSCHDNGTFDDTGTVGIGPRYLIQIEPTTPEPEPLCEPKEKVCCRISSNDIEEANSSELAEPQSGEKTDLSETDRRVEVEMPPRVAYPVDVPKPGCGVQRIPRAENLTLDQDNSASATFANYAQFPWMLIILSVNETTGEILYRCGASLIHPQIALTVAHCVHGKNPSTLMVRGGEWDVASTVEPEEHQDRNVRQIITHPNYQTDPLYDRGPLHNDIALLILDSRFDITENVDVICLPALNGNFDKSKCLTTGWGKDPSGLYQRYLRKVEMTIVPRKECETRLRETRLERLFKLHDSFLCAEGEPAHDTCEGSGGNPLVCPVGTGTDQWQQVGIVSWGVDCGTSAPGGFVNVSKYTEWVLREMYSFHTNLRQTTNTEGIWYGPRNLDAEPGKGSFAVPAVGVFTNVLLIFIHWCLREFVL